MERKDLSDNGGRYFICTPTRTDPLNHMDCIPTFCRIPLLYLIGVILFACSCTNDKNKELEKSYVWDSIRVTATAYNSLPSQTTAINSNITAWGDTLVPGMNTIAVSKDLIAKGLVHNTMVRLDTFSQIFLVKDRMHSRWRNRIDIYMGVDRKKALDWGRRKLTLYYAVKKDSLPIKSKAP